MEWLPQAEEVIGCGLSPRSPFFCAHACMRRLSGCADPASYTEGSATFIPTYFVISTMSFGFSVGDFIGAANLTFQLITALRNCHDASSDYRAAIDELGCYQTALMRVDYLGRKNYIARDTFDAASHMVMQSMEMIQSYLEQTKKYDKSLGKAGTSGFRSSVRKVRWTLLKADDMKELRETLQKRNAGLQLLLQVAGLQVASLL